VSLLSHFHQEEAGVHVQGEEGEGRQEPLLPEGQSHGFPSSLSFPHYSALPCPPPHLPLSLSFPPLRTVEMVDALARSDRSAHLAIHVHTLLVLGKGVGCCCCCGGGCVVVLYVGRAVMLGGSGRLGPCFPSASKGRLGGRQSRTSQRLNCPR
jgi:hypothetical protein